MITWIMELIESLKELSWLGMVEYFKSNYSAKNQDNRISGVGKRGCDGLMDWRANTKTDCSEIYIDLFWNNLINKYSFKFFWICIVKSLGTNLLIPLAHILPFTGERTLKCYTTLSRRFEQVRMTIQCNWKECGASITCNAMRSGAGCLVLWNSCLILSLSTEIS